MKHSKILVIAALLITYLPAKAQVWNTNAAGAATTNTTGDCSVDKNLKIGGKIIVGKELINGDPAKTQPGEYKLYVQGGILTEKLRVANHDDVNWADYVFDKDYKLAPLPEVAAYVQTNKHLPGIPSAAEVATSGIDVAAMDAKLLEKIEELTLYIVQQQKEIDELKKKVNSITK